MSQQMKNIVINSPNNIDLLSLLDEEINSVSDNCKMIVKMFTEAAEN